MIVSRRQQKVFILAVMLLAAMYLINLVVDNPYSHRLIRNTVAKILSESTNLSVDYRVMRVHLFPPALDLYGLEVARTDVSRDDLSVANRKMLAAAHIRVTLSIWSILIGRPQLASFEANNTRLEIDDLESLPNLIKQKKSPDAVAKKNAWPPDFQVPVRKIILRNAYVSLYQLGELRPVPLLPESFLFRGESIDLALTIQGWDSADVSLSAADVVLRAGGTSYLAGARMVADATYNTNTVDVKISQLESSGLSGDGSVRINFDQLMPQANLRTVSGEATLKVAGDIALVGSILDIPETFGPAKATVVTKFSIPLANGAGSPEFSVVADAESSGAVFGGFKLHNFKSRLDIGADRINFEDVQLIIGSNRYGTGRGVLRLDGPGRYSFQIRPDGLPLGKLLDVFNVSFDAFDLDMTAPDLDLSGTSTPFKMKASAAVAVKNVTVPGMPENRSAFPESPICDLNLRLDIDSDRIVFDGTGGQCNSSGSATSLNLSGPITFDDKSGINFLVEAKQADARVAEYFAQIPVRGTGAFSARIHGPYDHVVVSGDAKFTDFKIGKMNLGRVSTNWSVDGKMVGWENLRIVPEEGSDLILEKGSLDVGHDMLIKSKIQAANVPPELVNGFLLTANVGNPIAFGIESVQGSINGKLDAPLWWDIDATIALFDINYDGHRMADHATAKINSNAEGWRFSEVNFLRGDLSIDSRVRHVREKIRGKVRSTGPGISGNDMLELDAKLYSISNLKSEVDHLSQFPYLEKQFEKLGISGFLTGEFKFGGRIENLEGAFDMSVMRPKLLGSVIAPLQVKGVVAGQRFQLIVNQGGSALEGRMTLDASKAGTPFEWFFTANRMDLRFLATPWFASDPRNYCYLNGAWSMKGQLADFWRSSGKLNIATIKGRMLREVTGEQRVIDFKSEAPFEASFSGGSLTASGSKDLILSSRQARFRASIRDGNTLPHHLNIGMDGSVDLSLLRDMIPQIESATGKLSFKGQVTGKVDDPSYGFEVNDVRANPFTAGSWEPVSIGLADFRPPLRNIRLKANVLNGQVQVESFTAAKGSGRLDGAGTFILSASEEQSDSSLDVRLEDAAVVYPVTFLKSFESNVSGNLSLTGKGRPYRLSGDLQVTRARSTREVDLGAEILNSIRKQAISIPTVATDPVLQFDLTIRADQTVNVNNRLIQALLSTNLQIGGSDQQPSVLGQIDVVRGKFVYKRDFSITRGIISFDDPLRVDPTIEITAVSEVQNYRVYINMSGRASNPRVDFSIDPPTRQNGNAISKVDILVLLGRGSLPEEQQALGETQNVAATEALGFIWGQLDEPVEKLFDLSGQKIVKQVYFDTYASPEGKPLLRVNLPLNLGNDLDVVLRVDQEQSMKLSSEISVSDNISFGLGVERQSQSSSTTETKSTIPADTGADLKFRFAFP